MPENNIIWYEDFLKFPNLVLSIFLSEREVTYIKSQNHKYPVSYKKLKSSQIWSIQQYLPPWMYGLSFTVRV